MPHSPKVLIVEDSKFFASMIRRRIQDELGFQVDWKSTYADAVAAIDTSCDEYLVALLDVTLPDAPNGEIVEYAVQKGLPSIIFTGGLDRDTRDRFLSWNLVDYILKDSGSSVDTLLQTLDRVYKNQTRQVLVAEDSRGIREAIVRLLKSQLYQVHEATDGRDALEVFSRNPEISIIITDYEMPGMDGFELIKTLRANHDKSELAIIGMSASGDPLLSAKLIKSGANDFMAKPFQVEEFHCRVSHNVEMLENIALIRDLSYRDPLTKLLNRRAFFADCQGFINRITQEDLAYSVAMLDIDHFKRVNDTYGHAAGDEVLKTVAGIINDFFTEDAIVARFGGEEFCVLIGHGRIEDVAALFDSLRGAVEAATIEFDAMEIGVTVSIGICSEPDEMDAMLKTADNRLYEAKSSGRNRVVAQ